MEQNKKLIIVAVAIVVILGAFFGYRRFWPNSVQPNMADDAALKAAAEEANPIKQVEVNPFNKETNPYKTIKVNPFE